MKKFLSYSPLTFLTGFFIVVLTGCSGGDTSIFNGDDLEGWTCDPVELAGDWTVEDGLLVGENPHEKGSILWTNDLYRDVEVEVEYRTLTDDYDSGLFLRGISHQAQIGISRSLQKDLTACIYAPVDDRGKYPGSTDKVAGIHKVGEWNHLRVILEGKRIQTFLNGEPMVDYTAVNIPEEGPLGVQLHGNVHMKVQFRNLRVTVPGT
jgi:hypothetical protein